jgi:hypothetical protein
MIKRTPLIFVAFLILSALACGLPSLSPPQIPDNAAATAQAAAEQAAQAAATTAAITSNQGEELIATLQASDMGLDLNLDALSERFSNLQPDANGNVIIVLSDDEINQALRGQDSITQEGVTLEGISVMFTGGNVVLAGNMTAPLQSQLTASFSPQVSDGQLQFTLISATLGRFPVPTGILTTIESTLNSSIGALLNNLPQNFILQSISMGEGTMTIVIHQQ